MKKSLVSALTTALVVGAASTTFANPFADVAADHWAYDAIAQLAADGVIEGYGDGTYRGDQEITRYEVAQIVARAMAKDGVSGANKATIDKLAAEFAEELNSLGVRVAALEKKVDNVKWTGKLRYRTSRVNNEAGPATNKKNGLLFRLEPKATVNEHWFVQSRMDVYSNDQGMKTAGNCTTTTVDRAWAQGQYGKTTIKLGKFNVQTQADEGLVLDQRISGVQVTTGNKLKVDVFAGRINNADAKVFGETTRLDTATSIQGIQIYNDKAEKFTYGLGYVRLSEIGTKADPTIKLDKSNIWSIGAGYKFDKNLRLTAAYSRNNLDQVCAPGAKTQINSGKTSFALNLKYKAMNAQKPGSFDIFTGYRAISKFGTIHDSFAEKNAFNLVGNENGAKYWELGVDYCLEKNITLFVDYINGKQAGIFGSEDHKKFNGLYGEVNFNF